VVKLSIVIPYYNRKTLLYNVLKSIEHNVNSNVEIIIVDDGSDKEHEVDFNFIDYTLIKLKRNAQWRGPCVAYNTGFKAATGDVIMINSSECVHIGNVIKYVFDNLKSKMYLCFSCYIGKEGINFNGIDWDDLNITDRLIERISPINNWWGVNSTMGNFIPYCGVLNKEDMDILGGYDERFAEGIGYDDYDFTDRIYNLKLKMINVDDPFVVHQWHKPTEYLNTINLDFLNYLRINFPDRIKAENKL